MRVRVNDQRWGIGEIRCPIVVFNRKETRMPRDGFSALDLDELKSLLSQAYKDPPMFAATGAIRGFRRGYRIVTRTPKEEYL